jgi:hypothetical protein
MNRLKLAGVFLGAVCALAMMAASSASALGLPDVSIALGGTYPLHLDGESAAATSLGSASGVTLEGKGVALLLLATELSALGTFSSTFKEVKVPGGASCKTGSEPAGTVLTTGEYHVVPLNLTGTLGILFLVTFVELTCGATKLKVRGNTVGTILKAGEEDTQLEELGGDLEGSLGKPNVTSYYNDGGTLVTTSLETDAGLEFVKSDENVAGEVIVTALNNEMFEITGRL